MNLSNHMRQGVVFDYEMIKSANNNPAGTIIHSASQTVPAGYLLCDGSEVKRINYPDLFEAIGTTYGQGDGSTTFNLPNLINKFVEGSTTAGTNIAAGLPNINGYIQTGNHSLNVGNSPGDANSALYSPGYKRGATVAGNSGSDWIGDIAFNASRSNNIYGNSTTVQPPALTALPCIKAYNNLFISDNFGVIESWRDGTEWYRVWSDGLIEQGGIIPLNIKTKDFIKPFTDAESISVFTSMNNSAAENYYYGCTTTTTTMTFTAFSGVVRWFYARGY